MCKGDDSKIQFLEIGYLDFVEECEDVVVIIFVIVKVGIRCFLNVVNVMSVIYFC